MTFIPSTNAALLLMLIMVLLSGCTSYIPRESLPFPLTSEACDDTVKVVTVPLPVIASSPNEGITAGALSAFLIHNRRNEINTLLAPQVNHNEYFGITSSLYGAFYPSSERSLELNISKSTIINEAYEAKLRDLSLWDQKGELNLSLFHVADGSSRFYGFNARTPAATETNYTNRETGFNLSVGYNIGKHFQLVVGDRLRYVAIRRGAVTKVPYTKDYFSSDEVPGLNGFTSHTPRFSVIYSTLDQRDTPTFGGYTKISFEPSMKMLGGAEDYRHYEVEAKGFIPFDNARYITVFRFVYNQTLGNNVPFLEQSILGGENSLRGYGRNRFIDNSYFLCNIEERIRLFRWEIFDVTADWEIAPFIDMGAVMEALNKASGKNFEFNPGIGFRAIVRPNIVGRVDLGIGRDGPAIFVGLGYPF